MTFLESDPPDLAAMDYHTERELEAANECGNRTRLPGEYGYRVCIFVKGHTGPCSWAREEP